MKSFLISWAIATPVLICALFTLGVALLCAGCFLMWDIEPLVRFFSTPHWIALRISILFGVIGGFFLAIRMES